MASLHDSYEECRLLNQHYGTPFYQAINLFPKRYQPQIHAVCAFTRIIDQVIDHPKDGVGKKKQEKAVAGFLERLRHDFSNASSQDKYLQAIVHTAKFSDIPLEMMERFAAAMLKDLKNDRHKTYAQLKKHLDGTAGAAAEMVAVVIGSPHEKGLAHAASLARGGQIIKNICNAGTDYDLRRRVNFAESDLKKFDYGLQDLKKRAHNKKWRSLLEHYLRKAEADIDSAQKGLAHFPNEAHRALHTTGQIYLGLADSIRRMDYDVFTRRPDVHWAHRLRCALPF